MFVPSGYNGKIFEKERVVSNGSSSGEYEFANKPNLIILFAEGTSQIVVTKNLTPNLCGLMDKSIIFTNYFSHTAATFRGIRGTLISGYQKIGGYCPDLTGVGQQSTEKIMKMYQNKTESLPSILNDLGYETIFLSPHTKEEKLKDLMYAVGFQSVYTAEDFSITKTIAKDLTDRELYSALWRLVLNRDNGDKKPFAIVAYLFGTHHGMDSPDLVWQDGSNSYLNKFYNQDYWLGDFLSKYHGTPLEQNTLLVFTSDHASYPSPEFKETFGADQIDYMVDKIPFVIFNPLLGHKVIDAENKNSLSFTPTILNLLRINQIKNHFLGTSLFANDSSIYNKLSIYDNLFFDTSSGVPRLLDAKEVESKYKYQIELFYEFAG